MTMLSHSSASPELAQPMSPAHFGLAMGEAIYPVLAQLQPRIRGGLPPRAVRRVREYIEAHLEENVSIQVLADIAGLSLAHFARAFKRSEGLTPHDYLMQCRVRRAQDLLARTEMPLSEIALASGFADQSHFARRFKEHVGVTPGSYRWSLP
jgi:transcriptional regulator GlxA family with amidase domain